jgi:peptide subunit release factor 1 (eRF1)
MKFGIIVVDRESCMYATLHNNGPVIHTTIQLDLPSKYRPHGGRSTLRFERIRAEKTHNELRKCAEGATIFIDADTQQSNVDALYIAAVGLLSEKFIQQIESLPTPLQSLAMHAIKIQYGGKQGLSEVLSSNSNLFEQSGHVREQKVLNHLLQEIEKKTELVTHGFEDTLCALEAQCVKQVYIAENWQPHQSNEREQVNLLEYIKQRYTNIPIDVLPCSSNEGKQFLIGLGGIAADLTQPLNRSDSTDTWSYWLSSAFGVSPSWFIAN